MKERLSNVQSKAKIKQLRAQGEKIYSYSRLNTFHNCQYEYYRTYVMKKRGIGNCYSEIGTFVHDFIEKSYQSEVTDNDEFTRQLNFKLAELELLDLDFPNEPIKNSFTKDMTHFTQNFEKLDGEFALETSFVVQINGRWFMGFIDAIRTLEDDEVHIIDWKTSSKFTSKKIKDAGRQLVLYKVALEQQHNLTASKVMWNMLKYVYVCHKQKNKAIKRKMVNRGKLISEMRNAFEKDMRQHGLHDVDTFVHLETALKTNSMDSLPDFIKEKYWLEDCYLEYEVTDELIDELVSYVTTTIEEIESKNEDDVEDWKPLNIATDSFYCNTLCGHRLHCPFIKEYNKKQSF